MAEVEQSLEEVARRLRENEDGFTTLNIRMNPGYEAHEIQLLTDAVLANETLLHVNFFGILADSDVNEAARRLVESFGTLPRLESLKFSGYCEDTMQVLSSLLQNVSPTLQNLSIVYVQLMGLPQGFHALYQALSDLNQLESFRLVDCQFPVHSRNVGILDRIVDSLSRLSRLTSLELSPIHETALGALSIPAFTRFSQQRGNNLQKLHLYGFSVKDKALEPLLGGALPENCPNLRDLQLSSSLSEENCTAIGNYLRTTNISLQSLRINMTRQGTQTDQHLTKIAEALADNTSLESLDIYVPNLHASLNMDPFGKYMEMNYTLMNATFHGSGPAFSMQQRFLLPPLLDLYLILNRMGRGALIQNPHASREDWFEKLAQCGWIPPRQSLDLTYYFLSMNPSLCESCTDETSIQSLANRPVQ